LSEKISGLISSFYESGCFEGEKKDLCNSKCLKISMLLALCHGLLFVGIKWKDGFSPLF